VLAAAIVCLLSLVLALAPSGDGQTSCTPGWGSFGVGSWPPGCWHPFGASSPFNVPIPEAPRVSSESEAVGKYMKNHRWRIQPTGEAGNFHIDDDGSRPVYWSHSSDPLVKIVCVGTESCPNGTQIRIPSGARPDGNTDGHITIVDQEHEKEWDFWAASAPEHGEMKAVAGGQVPIGNGTGTGLGGVAEAAHLALLGGLIRAPELAAGKIEHALAIAVPCEQRADVWPAPSEAQGDHICPREGLGPHLGSLLQLNMSAAEIAASGAPKWQQTIMTAMAKYGSYVVDTGGTRGKYISFMVEDDASYTSFGYPGELSAFIKSQGGEHELVGLPILVTKLRVIDPCVPQRRC
jgi:hypothetical protein